MVKHIVCYKFKDNSRENLDRATAALLSMRFNVPQVLSVEAGAAARAPTTLRLR